MNTNITPPTALITGAARRIGAAIASLLHENGYQVIIHYHQSENEAQTLASALNSKRTNSAVARPADLRNKNAVQQLVANCINWSGRLDLLVNNASIFKPTDFNAINEHDWDELFITNVKAPFWLSTAAYPHLRVSQGAIINLTDIHAEKPLKNYAVYCQTKAALAMQTKVLAREFAPDVRVNSIAPGAIAWPEKENVLNPAIQKKIIASTPLKTHGHPSQIAQAVLSLAQNPFITGQTLSVDGGRSMV